MVIRPSATPRHGSGDDQLLAAVEQVQRLLRLDRHPFAFVEGGVVAARLELLVAEVLHRLEVQQAVDRARGGLGVELVDLAAELRAPVGHEEGERDVAEQASDHDRREPDLVVPQQVAEHQGEFDQRRQD